MGDDNNVLEKYAEAVRSGGYPETHPESEKKFGEIYPQDPEPAGPVFPSEPPAPEEKEGSNKWYIISIILAAILSAALLYLAFKPDPKQFVEDKVEEIDSRLGELQAMAESIQIAMAGPKEDPGTGVELAKIAAWERLQSKLITEFFATNKGPGVKALCISMGTKDRCIASSASTKKARKLLENLKR